MQILVTLLHRGVLMQVKSMASFESSILMVEFYIHGYHVYKEEQGWEPQLNEEGTLRNEPNDVTDTNAVTVVRPCEQAYYQELSTLKQPNTIKRMTKY